MNTSIKRVVIGAVAVGVIATAYAATRGDGKSKEPAVTYESSPAELGDVRSFVTATGIIEPWKTVDIKSNVDGRLERLYVDLGDRVTAGQILMEIDPTNTKSALDQAVADLAAARARKEQAQANLEQQMQEVDARIAAAQQTIASAAARLKQAEANNRAQPMRSDASVNQAVASVTSAEKSVGRAMANKDTLLQQLNELKSVTIPLNQATVATNLSQARTNEAAARREYQRQRNLQGLGYVSRSEMEATYARLASQEALVKQAQQRVDTLKLENELSVKELEARIRQSDSEIEEAKARVDQAKAGLDAETVNRGAEVPVRQLEQAAAQAALAQARADLRAATAQRSQTEVRRKELVTTDSSIVSASARQNQAQVNFEFTRVSAPRGGVIITKNVEQGTVVPSSRASIGSTNSLLQIGDTSKLWVKCQVDETDIAQVREGQKVIVRVEAYPELEVGGSVIRIDPQAVLDQNVTNIPVTVEISKPDIRFKPGMNATCEFIVNESVQVLTVPNEAVRETDNGFQVRVIQPAGPPLEVDVVPGLEGQDVTEIRSGIEPGTLVVTRENRPEAEEANNPFNPFGRFGGDRNRGNRGGAAGGRGGAPGGARGGAPGGPRGGAPGGPRGGAPGGGGGARGR